VKDIEGLKLPKAPPDRIVRRFKKKLPGRVLKTLRADAARGDRSARLWALYGDLLDSGMSPEQVLVVVRDTVWNKYSGQKREMTQLWTEINKAKAVKEGSVGKKQRRKGKTDEARRRTDVEEDGTTRDERSRKRVRTGERAKGKNWDDAEDKFQKEADKGLEGYNDFMDTKLKKPGWLVEGVWSEGAHGVLAGEPKTYKSVISTDLAVSVASGTNFLNHFKIPSTGPVLMVNEENDPGEFQDRLYRIAEARGLGGRVNFSEDGDGMQLIGRERLPIHLMNNKQLDLTDPRWLRWLSRQCVNLELALIILDPFYLMTPGVDENSASQVGPILKNLLKIKQQHGVGIQLIHHYRKQNVQAPSYGATRMSGTGVFHRWFESAVYVEKTSDPSTVKLQPDHRGHSQQGTTRVTFDLGTEDDLEYNIIVHQSKADKAQLFARLRLLYKEQDVWKLDELRHAMGMSSSKTLKTMVRDTGGRIRIHRTGKQGRPSKIVTGPNVDLRKRREQSEQEWAEDKD
jgi:hypothetical protein